MKVRFGLLSVSLTALALAIGAFHLQGTQAEPVAVAEFGPAPSFVAEADAPLDETAMDQPDVWLHPAAAQDAKALCAGSHGINLIALSSAMNVVCQDETAMGYLLMSPGRDPQLILTPEATEETGTCPDESDGETPDPSA